MATLEAKKKAFLSFSGPMVAAATPFNAQGELDVTQIEPYLKYLAKIGVKGAYIMGTTGEGYSLTCKEKCAVAHAWRKALDNLKAAGGDFTAVINISGTIVPEVKQLAAVVDRLGFDGIALLPPIYYAYPSQDHLVNYLKSIMADSAPNTPLLFYHIPDFTGPLKFELHDFIGQALTEIPQFIGAKFTDYNISRYAQVMTRFAGRIKFLAGYEETLLAAYTLGGDSSICAAFSLKDTTAHYLAMVAAFEKNDLVEARRHQQQIALKVEELRSKGNFAVSFKQALNKDGDSEGFNFGVPRAPVNLSAGSCPSKSSCCC